MLKISMGIKGLISGALFLLVIGCLSAMLVPGNALGRSNAVSGGTAGSTSNNQNNNLESCEQPLGTLSIFEDQSLSWWGHYRTRYPNLGTTTPVIRMMIQQSNCFVVVERGKAMQAIQRERELMSSGDLRNNSNFGKGQMVAADYTLSPSVEFKKSRVGKVSGFARKLFKKNIPLIGSSSLGVNSNEAATTLLLIDNRSGVQVSASVGSAKKFDFSLFGSGWNSGGFGSVSAFTDTNEGKVIMAAFADSYNQMVRALRYYKPQYVEGGLGTGGTLAVDGAVQVDVQQPSVTRRVTTASQPASTVTVNTSEHINVRRSRNVNIYVDDYDENALKDYYNALKSSVKNLSNFSAFTEEQIVQMGDMKSSVFAMFWAIGAAGSMEISKIELEDWPLEAREQGWDALGKKIKKYNKLFNKYRNIILKNSGFDQVSKDKLMAIELVTEESLFADS